MAPRIEISRYIPATIRILDSVGMAAGTGILNYRFGLSPELSIAAGFGSFALSEVLKSERAPRILQATRTLASAGANTLAIKTLTEGLGISHHIGYNFFEATLAIGASHLATRKLQILDR